MLLTFNVEAKKLDGALFHSYWSSGRLCESVHVWFDDTVCLSIMGDRAEIKQALSEIAKALDEPVSEDQATAELAEMRAIDLACGKL